MVKTLQQPSAPVVLLLRGLSWVLPWLAVIPTSASNDSIQYTDEERRAECAADTGSTYHGMIRLSTAVTLLDIASELHARLQEMDAPFWVGIGGREVVVDPQGVRSFGRCRAQRGRQGAQAVPDGAARAAGRAEAAAG